MPDRYLKVVEAADNVATALRELEERRRIRRDRFTEQVDEFLRGLKESTGTSTGQELRIPGEKSVKQAESARIEVDADLWDEIRDLIPSK